MADNATTELVCPICGKKETHNPFFEPYEKRIRSQVERACGFSISPVSFHPLCSSCKDWFLYLATEGLLNDEKVAYLKGGGKDEGKEETSGV